MRYRISVITILISLAGCQAGSALETVEFYSAEPFAVDLRPRQGPASMFSLGPSQPLTIKAARGEVESALLILRPGQSLGQVPVSCSGLENGQESIDPENISIRVIKLIHRAGPYTRVICQRLGLGDQWQKGTLVPDILTEDEPLIDSRLASFNGPVPRPAYTRGALLSATRPGVLKYLLVTVRVPDDAPAGDYIGRLEFGRGLAKVDVPIKLAVYPFVLQRQRGKLLSVFDDFWGPEDPLFEPALALLSDIGMNFVRLRDVLGHKSREQFSLLGAYGFSVVIQGARPKTQVNVGNVPMGFDLYFYGVDEPHLQPGGLGDISRLTHHVELSRNIHALGGKLIVSTTYDFAMDLTRRNSAPYRQLEQAGQPGYYEPLDWCNYAVGVQLVGWRRGFNRRFFDYVAGLQKEFREARWQPGGADLPSKHAWPETYYWAQGLIRDPYFARMLYGFYLFNSHLDGAFAWTLYRPEKTNPLSEPLVAATLVYPRQGGFYGTYSLEAIREGVDDLRYAQQAYRDIARLLSSPVPADRQRGGQLRQRFLEALAPHAKLLVGEKRVDLATDEPQSGLRRTREMLAEIIMTAESYR